MPGTPHIDGAVAKLYVELELDAGLVPVQGRVRAPSGMDRPFSGWLELMGHIERICEHARGTNAASDGGRGIERKEPTG